MAAISITCRCGRQLTLDTSLGGMTIPCPTCNEPLLVPHDSGLPAPALSDGFKTTLPHRPKKEPPARTNKPVAHDDNSELKKRGTPLWVKVAVGGLTLVALLLIIPIGVREFHKHRAEGFEQEQAQLPQKKQDRIAEIEKQVRGDQTLLTITGPSSLQAGAVNRYLLETKSLAGDEVAAKFTLRLLDKDNKELSKRDAEAANGRYAYTVPISADLKPGEQLTLEVSAERRGAEGKPLTLSEKLPLERPTYVTHLTTDKPMYQPEEVVAFRSLTLDRFSMKPIEEDLQLSFTIADPSGQVVYRKDGSAMVRDPVDNRRLLEGPDGLAIRGIGFGEYAISRGAAGGEYTLSVSELRGRFPPVSRKFLINRYRPPEFHKELEFTRRSYGPGDEVIAAGHAHYLRGGRKPEGLTATVTVLLDGKRLAADGTEKADASWQVKSDSEGNVPVKFRLPKSIDNGEASLSLQFSDGATVETIVRPIPVVVRRIRVDFYPEGGDLVAGVANRVYFTARTALGKPAEVSGRVLDKSGKSVAELKTMSDELAKDFNQGMGHFTFTPQANEAYKLQIDSPVGIPYKVELPAVKSEGVVLKVDAGSASNAEPIRATVTSADDKRRLVVAVYCRGRLVASQNVEVDKGASKVVALSAPQEVSGVFRITVYDDRSSPTVTRLVPVAERLVFRHPARFLQVALRPDKSHYMPGEKVKLAVDSSDEKGKRTGSIALVQVVDKSAISLADDKTIRSLPTQMLLIGEVRKSEDLENADFMLGDHPLAPIAVDLLLGTQGWRRFAEQDAVKFKEEHGPDAEKLLASTGQSPLMVTNRREVEGVAAPLVAAARKRIDEEFAPTLGELSKKTYAAHLSVRNWRSYCESAYIIAGLGLLLTILSSVAVAVVSNMEEIEKKNPGTIGAAFGIVGIGALIFVFLGFIIFLNTTMLRQREFQTVGASMDAVPTRGVQAGGEPMESMKNAAPAGAAGSRLPSPPPMPRPPALGGDGSVPGGGFGPMGGGFGGPMGGFAPSAPPTADKKAGAPREDVSEPSGATEGIAKAPPAESARRRFARVQQEQDNIGNRTGPAKERSFKELDRKNRTSADANAAEPFVMREYAHENLPGRQVRSDFTETVYWHPVVVMPKGETFVSFNLSDQVTSYQAIAYVHTTDGRLGAVKFEFSARLPFNLDSRSIPIEVTNSDEIHLPVVAGNDTDKNRQVSINIKVNGLKRLDGTGEAKIDVPAQKSGRAMFRFKPDITSGDVSVQIDGTSDFFRDQVQRTISIVPEGFPIVGVKSGTISGDMRASVVLPEQVTPGSLKVRAEIYPSILADVISGMEGMLREPHGCFEQTSSSNYPNLLILEYLNATGQSRPDVARRALDLLNRGYNRLLTFECQNQRGEREGYEWFGGRTPPHEALTAYGLMQFHDLGKVYDKVDAAMVERTRKFLLGRRDGNGNFNRKIDYHNFGRISQSGFNAYIVWALCESEADADLNKEVQLLATQSETSNEPYFLALVANSLYKRNDKAGGAKLLDKLVALQAPEGYMPGRESVVGSYGRDLHIEATALTVLAWLKAEQPLKYREPLQKAVRWLTQQRGGYGVFGSTQATILTLKALSQIARDSRKLTPGEVILSLNGNPILRDKVSATSTESLTLELTERDLAKLKPGTNEVRVELTGGNELPAKISWSYRTLKPPSADDCPLKLMTKLDKDKVAEGETVRLTVAVQNTSKDPTSMATAIIGLPAGLSLPEDLKQLTELTKPRTPLAGSETPGHATVSYFEVRGREIILYWRGLDAGQVIDVPIDLIARTPGVYRGPASRAYLYYGADSKVWVEPLSATISAK